MRVHASMSCCRVSRVGFAYIVHLSRTMSGSLDSARSLSHVFVFAGMSLSEQGGHDKDVNLQFSSSSEEEEEKEDEEGGPTEEEWCTMMETYLLSSTAPPSLETMLKSPGKKAAEKTLSQPRAKLLPGLSSPFSPTASSAYSITARRSFPLPVQPGHSHANLLKNPLDTHFLPPLLPTFNARAKVGVEEGQAARCQKLTDTQATLTSSPGQGNTRRCQSKESTARSAKEQAYRGRGRRNAQGTGTQGWRRVEARVEPNSLALCGRTLSRKRGSGVPYEGSSGLSRSGRPRKRSCFWGQDADEAEDDAHCSAEDARACEQKESKAGGGAGKGSESTLAGEIGVNARRKPALDMLSIQVCECSPLLFIMCVSHRILRSYRHALALSPLLLLSTLLCIPIRRMGMSPQRRLPSTRCSRFCVQLVQMDWAAVAQAARVADGPWAAQTSTAIAPLVLLACHQQAPRFPHTVCCRLILRQVLMAWQISCQRRL